MVTCAAEEKEKRIVEFDLPTYPPPRTEQVRREEGGREGGREGRMEGMKEEMEGEGEGGRR